MPLDFPSNPIDGQVSGNYQWSSASGAWKSLPTSKTVSTVSPTAPVSATAGDIWIDSTDGTSFYYYDDGTSKQWVELISSGIPSTPVSVINGGTGATTLTSGTYLKGAGTSAITTQTGIPGGDITSGTISIAYGGTGVTTGTGLVPIIPSSVSVSSGTGSIASDGKVTFTGAQTVTLNNVFSAAYDSYRLIQTYTTGTTGTTGYRLISGGTDLSAASYWFREIYMDNTANNIYSSNLASQTQGRLAYAVANVFQADQVEINTPFLNTTTNISVAQGRMQGSGPTGVFNWSGYYANASADSIRLIFPAVATGTFKIYGYR